MNDYVCLACSQLPLVSIQCITCAHDSPSVGPRKHACVMSCTHVCSLHFKADKPLTEIYSIVPVPFCGRSANNQWIIDSTYHTLIGYHIYRQSKFFHKPLGLWTEKRKTFFRSVFVGFSQQKTDFLVGFSVVPKTQNRNATCFFSQPTENDRNRPIFRWKTIQPRPSLFSVHNPHDSKKNDRNPRMFSVKNEKPTQPFLFSVYWRSTTLVAKWCRQMRTKAFEMLSF